MNKQKADKIITEYLQKIYGFAVKKSFSYDEAEELSSEIIKEVYTSLLHSEDIQNIEGYVWRISQHTYSKHVASRKKQQGISIDEMVIPYFEEYFEGEADDEINRLRREIGFLTESRRKIVYDFYYVNKSIKTISEELNIPEGTVKWHLNKARNDLKEGFSMERKIGKLGLSPITAKRFGHGGYPGDNLGPEAYLGDKINLNIVYSAYHTPRTKEEIAEELGMTLVYIEDRINHLEENGFLVKTNGNKYTTYVRFNPETYSLELIEKRIKTQLKIAEKIAEVYPAMVKKTIEGFNDVYIPDGNKELLEALCIFEGINNSGIPCKTNFDKYMIHTTAGGKFIAFIDIESKQSDTDYISEFSENDYIVCGRMTRGSEKYPNVFALSYDTRYSSRTGGWRNNLVSDYEYLYEFICGNITDCDANAEKFSRLRELKYITEDGKVNIMMAKGNYDEFVAKIPKLPKELIDEFAKDALEFAEIEAKRYPPQMQDLIIGSIVSGFIGRTVALMVLDILYGNGSFKPLTENEKITTNLIMFSDILPQ